MTEPSEATLHVQDSIKMLRETLCVAQGAVNRGVSSGDRRSEHSDRLQRLIDECNRQRPLASNGKHGNLHTPTCGCEDK